MRGWLLDPTTGGEMDLRGTAYGFEVYSDIPLPHLRSGRGEPLMITESPVEMPAPDASGDLCFGPPRFPVALRLQETEDVYRLQAEPLGRVEVDAAWRRITLDREEPGAPIESLIWGVPVALCLLDRGDLALNAAAVEIEGEAVLIFGRGRFGATTVAATFATAGYRVVSDGLSCVRLESEPVVVPGAATLEVSADEAARGDCSPLPLRAMFQLRSSRGDGIGWLEPASAVADVWRSSFRLPADDVLARCFSQVSALASSVPTWSIDRPSNFADGERVVHAIASTLTARVLRAG